jgi:hypothetical protein
MGLRGGEKDDQNEADPKILRPHRAFNAFGLKGAGSPMNGFNGSIGSWFGTVPPSRGLVPGRTPAMRR